MRKTSVYFPVLLSLYTLALWILLRLGLVFFTGFTQFDLLTLPIIFVRGLWFDLHILLVLLTPYFFLKVIFPNQFFESKFSQIATKIYLFIWIFAFYFGTACELVFWNEFSSRANFIAVDYLVYTHEVIGNIKESYPMGWIFLGLFMISLATFIILNTTFEFRRLHMTWRARFALLFAILLGVPASFAIHNIDQFELSNSFANEASNNGLFSLFSAYRRNDLNYSRFYKTIPQPEADKILADLGVERLPAAQFKGEFKTIHDDHESNETGPFKRMPKNVVLITVESLSASYLGIYGDKRNITPNLDRLAKTGYWFSHMFATGTRTVRGLEALSLGIPPVPGQAVVRRPHSDHLVTIGEMVRKQNIDTFFFYGGYGYFDNMDDYFLSNDYEVIDRTDFDQSTIHFANVWGVADETLFENAAHMLTQKTKGKDRFFAQIMTTSNHRPYTFPEGRIDIPAGTRAGAVKYTDYAIGKFIADAEKEPWFKDTLFIVIADHCASVAGKTSLPVGGYLIPMIFYGPDLLNPGEYDRTISQIDLAPTILDVMMLNGDSNFFGESLFENQDKPARAFISNYQDLGYYKNDILTVLKPKQVVETYKIDPKTFEASPIDVNADLEREAISFYQTADLSLRQGALKFHEEDIQ